MPTIEEIRKLLQDLLAPELRTLTIRIEALEMLTTERFKRLEQKIDSNHHEVMNALNLDKRLALLEDRQRRSEENHPSGN